MASHSDPDYQAASKGIRAPQLITLRPPMWVCRFASSVNPDGTLSDPSNLNQSAWWMSAQDFHKILYSSEGTAFTYKFLARLWLAVKTEWSQMDRLVIGRVGGQMNAWAGRGINMKEQMPNGMTFCYEAPKDLTQLFIPGMVADKKDPKSGYNLGNITVVSVNEVPPIGIEPLDRIRLGRS